MALPTHPAADGTCGTTLKGVLKGGASGGAASSGTYESHLWISTEQFSEVGGRKKSLELDRSSSDLVQVIYLDLNFLTY